MLLHPIFSLDKFSVDKKHHFIGFNSYYHKGVCMENYKEIFEEKLKEKRLRFTKQRMVLLDAIFSLHEHFTVESLYGYIKDNELYNKSMVSVPTIYRNLPLLMECGLIKKADISDDKDIYEHTYGHPLHVHIVCNVCKKVIEEDDTRGLYRYIKKLAEKHHFNLDDYCLSAKGICKECEK